MSQPLKADNVSIVSCPCGCGHVHLRLHNAAGEILVSAGFSPGDATKLAHGLIREDNKALRPTTSHVGHA